MALSISVSLFAVALLAGAEIAVAVLALHLAVAELFAVAVVAVSAAVDVALFALAVVAPARGSLDDASGAGGSVTVVAGDGGRGLVGQEEDHEEDGGQRGEDGDVSSKRHFEKRFCVAS